MTPSERRSHERLLYQDLQPFIDGGVDRADLVTASPAFAKGTPMDRLSDVGDRCRQIAVSVFL